MQRLCAGHGGDDAIMRPFRTLLENPLGERHHKSAWYACWLSHIPHADTSLYACTGSAAVRRISDEILTELHSGPTRSIVPMGCLIIQRFGALSPLRSMIAANFANT